MSASAAFANDYLITDGLQNNITLLDGDTLTIGPTGSLQNSALIQGTIQAIGPGFGSNGTITDISNYGIVQDSSNSLGFTSTGNAIFINGSNGGMHVNTIYNASGASLIGDYHGIWLANASSATAGVGTINNLGVIQGTGQYGIGIEMSSGDIDQINNAGFISGGINGAGIRVNMGTLGVLNNAQGTNYLGGSPLTYKGKLPTQYFPLITDAQYAQLSGLGVTGSTIFNLYPTSSLLATTYTDILTGIDSTNLTNLSNTYSISNLTGVTGTLGAYEWNLVESAFGSDSWNLVVNEVNTTQVVQSWLNTQGGKEGFSAAHVIDRNVSLLNAFKLINEGDMSVASALRSTLPRVNLQTQTYLSGLFDNTQQKIQTRLSGGNAGDMMNTDHMWVAALAQHGDQEHDQGIAGFGVEQYGAIIGADRDLSDHFKAGIAFSYGTSTLKSDSADGNQQNTTDSYTLHGYGRYQLPSNITLDGHLAIGTHDHSSQRDVSVNATRALADYRSQSYQMGFGIEQSYTLNEHTNLVPRLSTEYRYLRSQGYQEHGADIFNLTVNTQSQEQWLTGVQLGLQHQWSDQWTVGANIGLTYDALSRQHGVTAAFAGAPNDPFITYGNATSAWAYHGGLSARYHTSKGMSMDVQYSYSQRDAFEQSGLMVQAKWLF